MALPTDSAPRSRTLQILVPLFLISVLGLFVELMLIRWISTEIRIFAYLQNTVLVVCFLGLGMGCWTCRQPANFTTMLGALVALVGLLSWNQSRAILASVTTTFSALQDFLIWEPSAVKDQTWGYVLIGLSLLITLMLMFVVWLVFLPIGRVLGRLLEECPRPILAYSVNILGSLLGILLFVGVSAWYLHPVVWCGVAAALCLPFVNLKSLWPWLLLPALVALGWLSDRTPSVRPVEEIQHSESAALVWSPYQKLNLRRVEQAGDSKAHVSYHLLVNDTPYMDFKNLNVEEVAKHPSIFDPKLRGLSQYDLPSLLRPGARNMLVVGAGGGNDVAGGLRHGIKRIVAVEIDPAIIELGKKFHPEHPYASPMVTVVNDDARAYFVNSDEKFDLIVFGLLDSHTTTAMTNSRLDHYVYTLESLEQAKRRLADGGLVVLSFEANKPYIADRMASALKQTFGQDPIHFRVPMSPYGYGGVLFVVGNLAGARAQIESNPRLQAAISEWQAKSNYQLTGATVLCTDDWPYIYLEQPGIPSLYFLLIGMMIILFVVCLWRLETPGLFRNWVRPHWHFFFLGAAFMLLEVQNVSKAAVALGNTWDVNAVIIASILVLILFANLMASLWPRLPLFPVFVLLIGSCVGLYFVDLARFAALPYLTRALVVGGLTSVPMLFSGIVFIRSFAVIAGKDTALGANLLGSLVGGLLQTLTFLTGIKALLLIVAGLYFLAFLTRPRPANLARGTITEGIAASGAA
jgi:spermidine synthase